MPACPECGSKDLYGEVVITKLLPLAAKGGSVKVAGAKCDQVEMKTTWDKDSGEDAELRGPVMCGVCLTRLVMVRGQADPVVMTAEHAKAIMSRYGLLELAAEAGLK